MKKTEQLIQAVLDQHIVDLVNDIPGCDQHTGEMKNEQHLRMWCLDVLGEFEHTGKPCLYKVDHNYRVSLITHRISLTNLKTINEICEEETIYIRGGTGTVIIDVVFREDVQRNDALSTIERLHQRLKLYATRDLVFDEELPF